jgi:dTMP kinase
MFITFEGIEGSGKTSQIHSIQTYLSEKGHDVITTREPGSSEIGTQIRSILLDSKNKGLDSLAELLLYMADRAQHLNETIKPALSAGKIILCDRYFDATLAYQGYARGLDIGLITKLHQLAFSDVRPDLTLLLDLPAEEGLARAWQQIENGQRTNRETRFEEEALAFHSKVRSGYLTLAADEPQRFRIINATASIKEVQQAMIVIIEQALNRDNL